MSKYRWRVKVLPAIIDTIWKVLVYGLLGFLVSGLIALAWLIAHEDAGSRAVQGIGLLLGIGGLSRWWAWFGTGGRIEVQEMWWLS